jgi:thymidine kinase
MKVRAAGGTPLKTTSCLKSPSEGSKARPRKARETSNFLTFRGGTHRGERSLSATTVGRSMGTLRFSFGTMGSGKSTLALQIHHNLARRHQRGMLLSQLDRDGARVSSRLGVSEEAIQVSPSVDLFQMASRYAADHGGIDYIVCDETQFYTTQQIDELALIADVLGADVYAFGLITDFRGHLFEGTQRMLEVADERIQLQVEARCWCGSRATHNARIVNGVIVYEGETVVVGDTELPTDEPLFGDVVVYELLCRNHFRAGIIGRP